MMKQNDETRIPSKEQDILLNNEEGKRCSMRDNVQNETF